MKQTAAPGIFHRRNCLLFPLSSALQKTPLLILSHPLIFLPQTPSYSHIPSWLWFSNSTACVVCLCVHLLSFFPPALSESFLLAVYGLSVTEATTRERDKKRKWEGEGSVFHVFVACEVRKELALGTVWCDMLNEGLIYCFVCLLSGCSRCWLNRDGENICTSKAICVYYRLFMAVFLPTIVHTIYS